MAACPAYEAPPSYDSVIAGLCYVQRTPASQLSVVDFLAEDRNTRFPTLIERANQWLRQNGAWEARTCESVEFKSRATGIPSVQCVTFTEHTSATLYVRGLRLWLVPRRDPNLPPQQLACFNVVPREVGATFGYNFERLTDVISQLNAGLSTNPINGTIITIETQPMKFSTSQGGVDPDRTHFRDFGFSVLVIRVFYEIGPPAYETIGSVDFVSSICQSPYDTVTNLTNMAAHWIHGKPNIRMCNLQTISMKRKYGFPNMVDNAKMSIRELRGKHVTHYYRVLRLFFVVMPETTLPRMHPSYPFQGPLTCKTFLPIQLTNGNSYNLPQFESTQQSLTRISEWIHQHSVRVLSAETCVVRMYSGAACYGPDSTFFYNPSNQAERFINIVRLYLDGVYPDPHISMSSISYRGWSSYPVRDAGNIPPAQQECTIL